mmetsp:Transcript_13343/g.23904  ORF Transcript_13343/g.23904 Transcript_13343/m.23904 type:complete len:287 (+) Transcript_13343:175-1035(+)|eukprot:CAMPEP_0196149592 /NCGR_PEP_ID=MMETSP0910-20130528/30107_1 /TAXON_ID=49265 /ORGANISM="Thalassiosira rotula, Strain GSO102" /LENGTH=286 /DNA_ID=CAMNT_0041412523 /DNA_START=108 /DNA_END=968 /DNA_ORIENTATION=-
MKPFDQPSIIRAVAIAALMAHRGRKRKSLTPSGAMAAFVVGFLSIACGMRGFLLLLFYLVGTKATKYKNQLKSNLDQSSAESSCRGPSQVLACSVFGVIFQLAHVYYYGQESSIDFSQSPQASSLACALIAHHATSLADTLASELGILSKSQPILITTGRRVPPGTNGGVTLLGTGFSALGGLIIGIAAVILDTINGLHVQPLSYVMFGISCGILGSIVDSILGATLQVTHFDPEKKVVCNGSLVPASVHISGRDVLSNAQVNVASILITSIAGPLIGSYLFHYQN